MSTRAIASSTLWQVGSQVAMAALSVITVKCVAMGLSPLLAGTYNSSYGYLQLFGILADFGLYAVAVREVSRAKNREHVFGSLMALRWLILCLSLGTALAIVWLHPAWRGTAFPLAATLAAIVPFFTLLAGMLRVIFQVEYRMHFVFIAEVAQRILALGIIAAVVLTGVRETNDVRVLHTFILAGGIGAVLLFAISLLYARRLFPVRPHWDGELLKKMLKLAAPYGLAFLCMALYRHLDVTLIALLRDDFQLQNAAYGFALRPVEMAYLFPTFLLNSTLPVLSKKTEDGEDTRGFLGKTLFAIMLLSTTAFLFSLIWARPLMQLLTNDTYLSTPAHPGSDTAIMVLSIPMLMNGLMLFGFYSLLTRHAWRQLVVALCCGAAVSLGLNLILIPQFGFMGAATTSAIIHFLLGSILFIQSKKVMPLSFTWTMAMKAGAYAVILAAFLLVTRPFLTSSLLTAGGLCVGMVVMAGAGYVLGFHKMMRGAA